MARKNMTRKQREAQIMRLFNAMHSGELTAHDIAKIIDVAPSTYLRKILADLVDREELTERRIPHRANIEKSLYSRNHIDAN